MKVCLIVLTLSFGLKEVPWGFYAHRQVNRIAVFTLHGNLFAFFREHIDWLSDQAVNPDKRRYTLAGEAARHYIDIDHYGEPPFDALPRDWDTAVAKFTEDTLMAYGIGPWALEKQYWSLVNAFKENDQALILRRAADLGHYVGDLHVPLHCTVNYNGEMTNQKGIHAFWESRVPELFGDQFDLFTEPATYIDDKRALIWQIVLESNALVDSVLEIDRRLTEETKPHKKYVFTERGATTTRLHTEQFSASYHKALNHMVERRMRQSIHRLGCFWFSAWVDAGRPNLAQKELLIPVNQEDSLPLIDGLREE